MTKPPSPPNFFSLALSQVSDFLTKEWKNFQKDLDRAYHEELDPTHNQDGTPNFINMSNKARTSLKVINKRRREVQQRLFKNKGMQHIRNQTSLKKKDKNEKET